MQQYVTHHFAHHETLERARYWLAQLGFDPGMMELGTGHDHRISLPVERGQAPMVHMIFDALELGEQAGWHEHGDLVHQAHTAHDHHHHPEEAARVRSGVAIGWHPVVESIDA